MQAHRARHHRFAKGGPGKRVSLKARFKSAPGFLNASRLGQALLMPAKAVWRGAAKRCTTSSAVVAARQFKASVRQLKRTQRLIRQTASMLHQAQADATRRVIRPTRLLPSSRAALWRWYRQRGLSWERFVADHGPG